MQVPDDALSAAEEKLWTKVSKKPEGFGFKYGLIGSYCCPAAFLRGRPFASRQLCYFCLSLVRVFKREFFGFF